MDSAAFFMRNIKKILKKKNRKKNIKIVRLNRNRGEIKVKKIFFEQKNVHFCRYIKLEMLVSLLKNQRKENKKMGQRKLTELQWWQLGYDINDDATGSNEWNNGWCSFMVTRYTEDEVHPSEGAHRKWRDHRNEIARRSREKIAREKAEQARKEAWEEEFQRDYYTSWQMLSQTRRVPIDGNDYVEKKWWIRDEWGDEWYQSVYYYYDIKRSRRVSDEEYQHLKDLYVERYGGWEKIDLDHTTYDGRVWW